MSEEKKYEFKEPKENLHWISFNTKKNKDLLEEILVVLKQILDKGIDSKPPADDDFPF